MDFGSLEFGVEELLCGVKIGAERQFLHRIYYPPRQFLESLDFGNYPGGDRFISPPHARPPFGCTSRPFQRFHENHNHMSLRTPGALARGEAIHR
jgi:hypothetical protein